MGSSLPEEQCAEHALYEANAKPDLLFELRRSLDDPTRGGLEVIRVPAEVNQ